MSPPQKAIVLRVEKTSIHDGAGLRTVVFLKGCPLSCRWCSTPEGQADTVELGLSKHKCDECRICVDVCPEACFSTDIDGSCSLDRRECTYCLACVETCPRSAIQVYGREMTDRQVIELISRDEIFYFHSDGGVTISGGECLAQAAFVQSVLKECRTRGIATALETSLLAPWQALALVVPHLTSLYVDIKHSDSRTHRELTGVGNERIWENLIRLDRLDQELPVVIRIPLIPGLNDSDANLRQTLERISPLKKVQSIELLPYHRLGVATYADLGREYALKDLHPPSPDYLREREDFLRAQNTAIPVTIAG
ncbi:MAG: glycyl-radical enzyme activating protein [Desulfofustis sp.]|nr:glycyl-radical enzyme activating protein [Desulfofustis sp.]